MLVYFNVTSASGHRPRHLAVDHPEVFLPFTPRQAEPRKHSRLCVIIAMIQLRNCGTTQLKISQWPYCVFQTVSPTETARGGCPDNLHSRPLRLALLGYGAREVFQVLRVALRSSAFQLDILRRLNLCA